MSTPDLSSQIDSPLKELYNNSKDNLLLLHDNDSAKAEYFYCVDDISSTNCVGWLYVQSSTTEFMVSARIGDWMLGTSPLDIYRDDLREAGFGNGIAGFQIDFTIPIDPSLIHLVTIEAARVSDGSCVHVLKGPTPGDVNSEKIHDDIAKISPLLDKTYYYAKYKDQVHGFDAISHYYLNGRFRSIKPNALFDPDFYIAYSKVFFGRDINHEDALRDYVDLGEAIGARPSPLFDPNFIAAKSSVAPNSELLQYYISLEDKDEVQTSLIFWPHWYGRKYGVSGDFLNHYLEEGIKKGYQPNPLFTVSLVRDLLRCKTENVLHNYFIAEKSNPVKTHTLINTDYILQQVSFDKVRRSGKSVLEYYIDNHRQICPNRLFDNEYFVNSGNYTSNAQTLLSHYLEQSTSDLKPHPLFWDCAYKAARPDITRESISPLEHYYLSGFKEYVRTHPLINHNLLIEETAARNESTPLEYYIEHCLDKNLSPDTGGTVNSHVERQSDLIAFKIDGSDGLSPRIGTVGLFAHVYYLDLISEVADVARNLPTGSKIFISTDTEYKAKNIRAQMGELCEHHCEVRSLPNRGRDIAPFLVGFSDRLREVDYGVHIHTKKSPHYSAAFSKWRRYLYTELAGSPAIVAGHLTVLQHPEIGMSAPIDFAPLAPLLNWGGNRQRAEHLIGAMGGRIPSGFAPELPSGSMFWFKTAALKPFLDLRLSLAHFDPEAGQVDGTLAHVIERCFFNICELSGHKYVRTTTQDYVEGVKLTSLLDEAMKRTLPSAWCKNGILETYHPETRKFVAKKVLGGPRLNLLIPTADTSVGYAGVSEAIRLFVGALASLGDGWSGRIVMTDIPPNNMFTPPPGFRLVESFNESEKARNSVVDGCDRDREFFTMREQDVFVTSAWWNAGQAFDLIRQAEELYADEKYNRKLIYLVQDDERGFNPWSTKYKLCDDTYNHAGKTFAVFNTPLLAQHFANHSISSDSFIYEPPINHSLAPGFITPFGDRENIAILYARPHAVRNGLDFLDAVVGESLRQDWLFWRDWTWLAIGEDFNAHTLKSSDHVTVKGRLTLEEYRDVLSRAKLGISLMVSPHPSYPPLEMAAHGVRVVANRFETRDLSDAHSGITTFNEFDPTAVSLLLKDVATRENMVQEPKINWFFNEKTNAISVFSAMADAAERQFG
ncbi:rhamnosyltransferase WsaF family glycosyltransferase [Novosphingobium lindaniclasticum]|uniref:rhamnosyltransferase WsaF family glycosyltransferase n=1 Tax=Novosphingobium lindaniclasticum TaxID=1329895 RepID=UPI00041307F5|nr:rhamnan synthesis F family protein [Novosphingobium lindaniclasticum]